MLCRPLENTVSVQVNLGLIFFQFLDISLMAQKASGHCGYEEGHDSPQVLPVAAKKEIAALELKMSPALLDLVLPLKLQQTNCLVKHPGFAD
tara:strand:+ start:303 stop:578 length:276 start_codon:yes stop_codon:yes gene_type:complete